MSASRLIRCHAGRPGGRPGFRELDPGETDHELIWLLVSIISILLAWGWLYLGLPRPQCFFHGTTGIPCPGCGSTRALLAALSGELGTAFALNPLVTLGLVATGLFDAYAAVVLMLRLPRFRIGPIRPQLASGMRLGAAALLGVNWIYLLIRS